MALSTLAAINDALPGQRLDFAKSATAFGAFVSLWASGSLPAAGATPSSGLAGDVPTDATAGAFAFVNPASGNSYLGRATIRSDVSGSAGLSTLFLYDRLWHNSGTNATITTAQTVNSVALTRPNSNGDSSEAWWHVYATMGAGTPTVTLTYTNQSGTGSRSGSSGVLATALAANRTGPFTLAAGDTGVRSIQTWQADATFSSGTINLVIRRLVAMVPMVRPPDAAVADALAVALPRIYDDACLELIAYQGSANTPMGGSLYLVQG